MKNIILTFLFLFMISFSLADTTIPGGNVSGEWTVAGSPYYIDGEITIQMSDNLTIQPGVEVKFNGHYKFIAFGKILAEGTLQDSIIFTSADTTGFSNIWTTDGGWHGLRFMSCIYNGQGNSRLKHCKVEYAKSLGYGAPYADRTGGGIYINLSSNLEITNCRISNNVADYGGGIYIWESSPTLSDLTITNNFARHDAGGMMFSGANTDPILENSIISGNSCHYDGGGIFCCSGSAPIISNVAITGNSCIDWEGAQGGGISIWEANPVINNVVISDNYSVGSGGGVASTHNSLPTVINCMINRNIADWVGGGISIESSSINLSGVTISENITNGYGGGIYFGYNSEAVFNPENRCNIYCNININGNLGNDLRAYNTNINVIIDTFTVLEPTEYYASPIENFTFDILSGMIDPVNADLYVSPEGDNSNSGLTANDPLKNIFYALQKIIGEETNPVSIFLANGIYSPSQTNEFFSILCKDYVDIIGENRENTILDAEETNRVISSLGTTHSIKNLTIKNGSSPNYRNGGGIFIGGSNIELENLLITSNNSDHWGSGIYCEDSNPILTNVLIENNSATGFSGFGGGIYFDDSNPVLSSVTISNNYAGSGSGIVFFDSNPVFDAENRCNIYNNSSEINYGNDIFLGYYNDSIDVFIDTFTVYYPSATQINYPGKVTIDIQNSIILPIDADIFVSPAGSDENSGLTPDESFKTISFAVNSIVSNEENPKNIYLNEGIYSTSNTGEQFPLSGKDNVRIIGENRETSIIDGENNKGLFLLNTVQNFTLKNMQLTNGNALYDYGGAISTGNSILHLDSLIISNNTALYGGGIYNWGSEIEISRTDFIDNSSTYAGGGISSSQSNIKLDRVLFYNNIAHCSTGGAIKNGNNSNLEVVNCTFYSNEAPSYFGAIHTRNSNTIIVNSILWNDLNNELCVFSAYNEQCTLTITNSDIEGGEEDIYIYGDTNTINWLENNIDTDPLFVDTLNGDFNLTENSPCVDAGTAFFEWNGNVIVDLEEDEYFGSAPDMGAFESEYITGTDILPVPLVFSLKQNFPNPFNPDTNILYSLPVDCDVKLSIYNIKGQKVRTLIKEKQEKGHHSIVWNGKDNYGKPVSSGIYFYKIKAKGKTKFSKVRKMMLIK